MNYKTHLLMYSPGNENEGGSATGRNKENDEITGDTKTEEPEENKTLKEKIHDALQDWINKDTADQAYDDTRP